MSSSLIDRQTQRLKTLKARRNEQRTKAQELYQSDLELQKQVQELQAQLQMLQQQSETTRQQITDTEHQLFALDDDIEAAQGELKRLMKDQQSCQAIKTESDIVLSEEPAAQRHAAATATATQANEVLTDPLLTMTMHPEEQLSDPTTQQTQHSPVTMARPPSRVNQSVGPLELITDTLSLPKKRPANKPEETTRTRRQENNGVEPMASTIATAFSRPRTGTLDDFFVVSNRSTAAAGGAASASAALAPRVPPVAALTSLPPSVPSFAARSGQAGTTSPWNAQINDLLHNTFRIEFFRDHQEEIIHTTLSGTDVFVIMRTGGGKSLTYQLPALLEGRGPQRKITFVVSPLLSLIQDQEEQMNQFCRNSAVSFTSGLTGGSAEHARRWGLVRDPNQGVCLVLITPEKVSSSTKLRNEMQKLHDQGRLGRIVIDECHCASQMGHDFRPDYLKLGVLKRQFPSVPVMAVTATASTEVQNDCCRILELNRAYRFFRSTANRLNLQYAVRSKPDGKDGVILDMVSFIKENHPSSAGIVYTFSKKDADTVADRLCEYGIVARSYHSDVSPTNKEYIHKSWMRNETQVVVATIAFGLGINKPDVRFVLHHTLSKTLDSYYQESGRAGRDGKDADCLLYYSPKDVPRMIKMVHDTNGGRKLSQMARYAQAAGNDAVCRAILLKHLAEPNAPNPNDVLRQNDGITTEARDVGRHAQTVARLLALKNEQREDVTLPMLVKEWRSKPDSAEQCVRDFPPGKDLTVAECERIIISLWLESVFDENVRWTAYDAVVYFRLGARGLDLVSSSNPIFVVRFPKKEAEDSKAAKQAKARKSIPDNGEWLTAKPKPSKRKKTSAPKGKNKKAKKATKKTKAKKAKSTKSTKKRSTTAKAKVVEAPIQNEVIELSSDDEDEDDDEVEEYVPSPAKKKTPEDALFDDESDDEYEFGGQI